MAASLPADSSSRETTPTQAGISIVSNRKRKHNALSEAAQSSNAPSDGGLMSGSTEILVVPRNNELTSRPRLKISRHPVFSPSADGSEYHLTEQLAMNRMGFRYTPAGVAPAGFMLPCRTIESAPTCYRVSWEDRSPFIKVTTDGLGLAGDKGFRSARCNAPVREGRWYMEVKIERGGGERNSDHSSRGGSHVRLGWGRREAPLNGPVGLDGYSYGYRDKTGEKVTLSRPRPYGRPFGTGDVVGVYICLPSRRHPKKNDHYDPAHIKRERIAIEFKGQEYFETLEYTQSKEMIALMDYPGKSAATSSVPSSSKKSATVKNLPDRGRGNKTFLEPAPLRPLLILPESFVAFSVNGEWQGIAFHDIYDYLPLRTPESSKKGKEKRRTREGVEHKENPFDDGSLGYYPFISLFNGASVRLNPGPNFDFPPDSAESGFTGKQLDVTSNWQPLAERYPQYMAEQWALDAEEEEQAREEAASRASMERVEYERRIQREAKRHEAEIKKKIKKGGDVQRDSTTSLPTVLELPSLSLSDAVQSPHPVNSSDRAHSPVGTPMYGSTSVSYTLPENHMQEYQYFEEEEDYEHNDAQQDENMTESYG